MPIYRWFFACSQLILSLFFSAHFFIYFLMQACKLQASWCVRDLLSECAKRVRRYQQITLENGLFLGHNESKNFVTCWAQCCHIGHPNLFSIRMRLLGTTWPLVLIHCKRPKHQICGRRTSIEKHAHVNCMVHSLIADRIQSWIPLSLSTQ